MKKPRKFRDSMPGPKLSADEIDAELVNRVLGVEKDFMVFLKAVGQGCIDNNLANWPQLKPACAWAFEQINQLKSRLSDLESKDHG